MSQPIDPLQLTVGNPPLHFLIQLPGTSKTLCRRNHQGGDLHLLQNVSNIDGLNKLGVQRHSLGGMSLLLLQVPMVVSGTTSPSNVICVFDFVVCAEIGEGDFSLPACPT